MKEKVMVSPDWPVSDKDLEIPKRTRLQRLMSIPLDPPRYICSECNGLVIPARTEEGVCDGKCKRMMIREMTHDDRLNWALCKWQKENGSSGFNLDQSQEPIDRS